MFWKGRYSSLSGDGRLKGLQEVCADEVIGNGRCVQRSGASSEESRNARSGLRCNVPRASG